MKRGRAEMKTFFCLSCGDEFKENKTNRLRCPRCKKEISRKKYGELFHYSAECVQLGIIYRVQYEQQLKEFGQIRSRYALLPPPDWVVFAGMAALSGIIGNASYHAVCSVLRRIWRRHAKNDRVRL